MAAASRRAGVVAAVAATALAVTLTVTVTACAGEDATTEHIGHRHGLDIGFLLPDNLGRWEGFDRPAFESEVRQRCDGCAVETVNAQGDLARQQQQVDSMVTRGVDVLVLVPLDAKAISSSVHRAQAAGVPVIAYDRLAEGPVSAYASFDNVQVGRLQGRALLQALGERAPRSTIVMINGDPSDPNAELFERGALAVLSGRVHIGNAYDTFLWSRERAYTNMASAVVDLGPGNVNGVLAANDSLASGAIAALEAAGFDRKPPVTGQDAELSAVQRIVLGEQYMTVYKPFQLEAGAAAEMALALGRGEDLDGITNETVANGSRRHIPAMLATPLSVTVHTIAETVVQDGLYTVAQICTEEVGPACRRAGLTEPSGA